MGSKFNLSFVRYSLDFVLTVIVITEFDWSIQDKLKKKWLKKLTMKSILEISDSGNGKPFFCKCPEGFHGEECEVSWRWIRKYSLKLSSLAWGEANWTLGATWKLSLNYNMRTTYCNLTKLYQA